MRILIATSMAVSLVAAQSAVPRYEVRRAAAPMTIDGKMDEASWTALVETTTARFGPVDVLANNAGILRFGDIERMPAAEVEPIDVPLLKITDNHAIGEIQLPSAGQWQLRFTLRTTEIDQASVTAEVPIR